MKPTFAASLALLVAVTASQASPPASQPSTKPALKVDVAEFPAMQRRLAELSRENAALRTEVEKLKEDLAAAKTAIATAAPIAVTTGPAEFGIGWIGTFKNAVCRQAVYQRMPDEMLIEFYDQDGRAAGLAIVENPPFKTEVADRVKVPAKYESVRVQVTGQFTNDGRTVFVAKVTH